MTLKSFIADWNSMEFDIARSFCNLNFVQISPHKILKFKEKIPNNFLYDSSYGGVRNSCVVSNSH